MKYIYLLILVSFSFCCGSPVFAQSVFYGFSKTTATYSALSSPVVLSTTMSANYEVMPMPAGFKTFNVLLPSSLKVGSNGWIVCTGPTRSFAFNPFLDGLHASATTSIGYKLETTPQDSILKIEWRDVSPDDAIPGEVLSFQLWFYKKSQAIEFHYGPSTVSTVVKPAIQVALLSPDFLQDYEIHSLTGSTANVKDSLSGDTTILHAGVPPQGTVYRYSNPSVSVQELLVAEQFRLYPNPAGNRLYIDVAGDAGYSITDMVVESTTGEDKAL